MANTKSLIDAGVNLLSSGDGDLWREWLASGVGPMPPDIVVIAVAALSALASWIDDPLRTDLSEQEEDHLVNDLEAIACALEVLASSCSRDTAATAPRKAQDAVDRSPR